jgi:hypothetical protein
MKGINMRVQKEKKVRVRITSTQRTSQSGLGSNRKMEEMVGKYYTGTIYEDPPVIIYVNGWNWEPEDVCIFNDNNVKIEYPKPETFNTNLLDT